MGFELCNEIDGYYTNTRNHFSLSCQIAHIELCRTDRVWNYFDNALDPLVTKYKYHIDSNIVLRKRSVWLFSNLVELDFSIDVSNLGSHYSRRQRCSTNIIFTILKCVNVNDQLLHSSCVHGSSSMTSHSHCKGTSIIPSLHYFLRIHSNEAWETLLVMPSKASTRDSRAMHTPSELFLSTFGVGAYIRSKQPYSQLHPARRSKWELIQGWIH